MKLIRAEIKNFRSIKDEQIIFDPACRVLVGINESGKTNVLKALSLLGNEYDPKKDDLREALPDENPITESYIRFVFALNKDETEAIAEEVAEKLMVNTDNPIIALNGTNKISLKKFCAQRNECLYRINIIEEKKDSTYWSLPSSYKLMTGWKKPSKSCPADFTIEAEGQKFILAKYSLVRTADFENIPENYLEDASIGDLSRVVGNAMTSHVDDNLPEGLFWEYSEDNLLPNSIKIAEFSANPELCVPLKNMFNLAEIDDIKTSISEAREGTDNKFQNYLNRIAKKTTNHFKSVWKEYKDIEFSLKLNADQIIPGVKEKNIHDFAKRSDGFKRFVTFLLLISVNVKTENLTDTLLLIDEPDASLHPSGARYLRDELIRISRTNYVVFSTHSIFMIDSEEIGRHYIVKKKSEIISVEKAESSNIADEEVLYNALGHSVFSILKEKNIIFEGWTDKCLFQTALENASAKTKSKFKNVGFCHSRGAKAIKAITPMIELAGRKCLVISDCDAPSKEQQKLYQKENGYGSWKTYQEIDSSITAMTAEDFIKNDQIVKQFKAILPTSLPAFVDTLPESGKLAALQGWLARNGIETKEAKYLLEQLKNYIFANLKFGHIIEETYSKILEGSN